MKIKLFILLSILVFQLKFSIVKAQKLIGNEWINYGQNYLKLVIDQTGIYRINKEDLEKNGFDTQKINPKNLQLFFRGKEMAISIKGQNDNKFDIDDYIEFFAINNDGEQDSVVYRPRVRPNRYVSIYSPKTAYFLIYNPNTIGKRIIENAFFDQSIEPEQYYISKILKVFDEDWNYDLGTGGIPALVQSYFEPNETLVSAPIVFQGNLTAYNNNVKLENYLQNTNMAITYESLICSRYDARKVISVSIGSQISKIPLENFKFAAANATISSLQSDILPLKYNFESSNSSNINDGKKFDMFSILYYQIKYPRKPIFSENSEYEILTKENNAKSLLRLSAANEKIIGYDIEDIYNQKKLNTKFNIDLKELNISIENSKNKIWLSSIFLKPKSFETVIFSNENYSNVDYLIVTDSTLINGTNKYKAYRESNTGGGHKIAIGIKQKLFDEFSYGERNPIAINRFIENVFKYSNPKYLLLLGKSRSTPTIFKTNELEDLTPTMGYPASDVLLSAGINGKSIDIQSLATGRIAALTNEHIIDYLEKVKEYEANNSNGSWKKRVLHLGGGRGESQINDFKSFLGELGEISKNSVLGSEFSMLNKANALTGTENIDISKQINDGIGVVTFFGHSSSLALDLNIGYVSDEKANFKNAPNYPFMFFNGCAAGNVFQKPQSLTNDWIITPKKGAIAVLAHSFLSYSNTNTTYMEKLYKTWFSTIEMLNKPIGEVVKIVNENIIKDNPNDIYMIVNTQQMILQGDPAVKIFNFNKPDFKISDDKIFLLSDTPNKTIGNSSKIKLSVVAENLGIYDIGVPINVKLKKTYQDNKIEEQIKNLKSFGVKDTLIFSIDNDLSLKSIEIAFDSDFQIDEINEDNNKATFNFNWEKLKNLDYFSTSPFEDIINPILNVKYQDNLIYDGIKLKADDILDISLIDNLSLGNKADKITIFLKKVCDSCNETLNPIVLNSISGGSNELFSAIKLEKLAPGNYQLFIQGFDAKNNSSGEVYSINFTIEPPNEKFDLNVHPNPISIFTNFEIFAPQKSNFELKIYNTQGKNVFSKTGQLYYGKNEIFWNAKDNQLNSMPNGLYLYNLIVNSTEMLRFQGKILLNN